MRQLRGVACGERGHDLAFEVAPGEAFGLDFDSGVLRLELAGDLVESPDSLWLGFGVPHAYHLVRRNRLATCEDEPCEGKAHKASCSNHRLLPLLSLALVDRGPTTLGTRRSLLSM